MKALTLMFLTIIAPAIVCAAQNAGNAQDPADLIVIKLNWERRQLPEGWDRSDPISDGSGRANDDLREPPEETADITELATQRKMSKRPDSNRADSNRGPKDKTPAPRLPDGPDQKYLYHVTFKNTGAKTIKSVDYEYRFIDPETKEVVARHEFHKRDKISPGKQKKLTETTTAAPLRLVDASSAGRAYTEQVVITRIDYSDGTTWERKADQ